MLPLFKLAENFGTNAVGEKGEFNMGFKGQGRRIQTTAFAAGSASKVLTPPSNTIGFYATAASAFTVKAGASGDGFPFGAGDVSFYYEHQTGSDVTIADQAASDTGAGAIAWVIED